MSDLIRRDDAIEALAELARKRFTIQDYFQIYLDALTDADIKIRQLPSAQPEIIRCKDCKYWVPGYITDNDDFIPPKCGEWQQMVGHSSDDYCSLAERREDG